MRTRKWTNISLPDLKAPAKRIVQLGGEPNLDPKGLSERSHSENVEGHTLVDVIREDLVAERIAIESYADMIRHVGENDPTIM